jgi:TDG/mug DNA glycosylase family protein
VTDSEVSSLPDLLAPGIEVLFVGINPSLYSARAGHYYARPGNLFWRCLHEGGLTPVRLRSEEDRRVLEWRLGITDCVKRPTVSAAEVAPAEFREGVAALMEKIAGCRPLVVCFNGLIGYRGAFDPRAGPGLQPEPLVAPTFWSALTRGGSPALQPAVFVVPSTSGANAAYSREERIQWFAQLRELRDELKAVVSG